MYTLPRKAKSLREFERKMEVINNHLSSVMSSRYSSTVLLLMVFLLCGSCYKPSSATSDAWDMTTQQQDSISFHTTHHYSQNYNFVVRGDSLLLARLQPDGLPIDSVVVYKGDNLVVADFMTIPSDTIDSVWVKVARDQQTQGWLRESELLPAVSPDDPISWFIDLFDNVHLLIFLAFTVVVAAAYGLRRLMKRRARIVHFNDIPSLYPTLLCLLVASSATLYSSIQMFAPESWRHFYYHPTLNPLALPLYLGIFISSVWLMLVVALAALDDIRRQLYRGEAVLYACSMVAVCAVCYVVFSLSTLYFVGYPLLIAYIIVALRHYFRHVHGRYLCGRCGETMPHKGQCPHCGAINE